MISRYPHDQWMAFVLDVCKAHKRVKVHPSEQGFSIFTVVDADGNTRWLVYKTCHFGCAWAAFWRARVADGLVRLTHRLIAVIRHFLAIYVDDNLSLLPMHTAPTLACLQIILACVLGVPLSWHKLYLGRHVRWIGWLFNLDGELCASLPEDKVARLTAALRAVAKAGSRHSRRSLQSLVGLLSRYTCGARWLKPWMSIWFHMLLKQMDLFKNPCCEGPSIKITCLNDWLLGFLGPEVTPWAAAFS